MVGSWGLGRFSDQRTFQALPVYALAKRFAKIVDTVPPQDRKRRTGLLIASTIFALASVVNLWRAWRPAAIVPLILLLLSWVLNLTLFSQNRQLPRKSSEAPTRAGFLT